MSALDQQEGGTHYQRMAIQPAKFIMANGLGFCEGNIIKYVCRYPYKNGIEDLKKARHYLDMIIEQFEIATVAEEFHDEFIAATSEG